MKALFFSIWQTLAFFQVIQKEEKKVKTEIIT